MVLLMTIPKVVGALLCTLVFKLVPLRYLALMLGPMTLSKVLERKGVALKGSILGVPYDLRSPTTARILEGVWNLRDPRVLTPHVYGIGWSVNLYSLAQRLSKLLN